MSDAQGPRWGSASDLSRVLSTGTGAPAGPVPAPDPVPTVPELPPGLVVASPPAPRPHPKPLGGLRLSLPARVLVGAALAAALGFMVWNAWQNLVG
ncbi:MAG TPA: hypothetical protein VFL59_09475 [Candidatus Nanopelagicales bacterium]|nr:hypothetical protein [Candidatus Nanopelagicales bacterium]